jgi:hypothetical protein
MRRLAIALVSVLAASAVDVQVARSEQPNQPAVAGPNGSRPFLFDGRMRGDGVRQRATADDRHPSAGAIVVPSRAK